MSTNNIVELKSGGFRVSFCVFTSMGTRLFHYPITQGLSSYSLFKNAQNFVWGRDAKKYFMYF